MSPKLLIVFKQTICPSKIDLTKSMERPQVYAVVDVPLFVVASVLNQMRHPNKVFYSYDNVPSDIIRRLLDNFYKARELSRVTAPLHFSHSNHC